MDESILDVIHTSNNFQFLEQTMKRQKQIKETLSRELFEWKRRVRGWVYELVREWVSEWDGEWVSKWVSGNRLPSVWLSLWVWVNVSEWVSENEWVDESEWVGIANELARAIELA